MITINRSLREKPSKAAAEFFAAAKRMVSALSARWCEEVGCENIEDYKTPLEPIASRFGVTIVKMIKRPFGCEFTVDGRVYRLSVRFTEYSYKRIG